jgi:FAD:protein FMN transferase
MTRCKPLLGTYFEISIHDHVGQSAVENAYLSALQVQALMGFHNPQSELNTINRQAHLAPVEIHPWTAQVIRIAQEIHQESAGLFNCGIGHRLVAAGLLPNHLPRSNYEFGGIEDIQFLAPDLIKSSRPVCLDFGGIAKGFAVDMAVRILMSEGVQSGVVNAGGDMRVFGNSPQPIQIRNPKAPNELLNIGYLENGAIATSSLYFAHRDKQRSHFIHPYSKDSSEAHGDIVGSFSVIASECGYADALTKVLALSDNDQHPCFERLNAKAIRITA